MKTVCEHCGATEGVTVLPLAVRRITGPFVPATGCLVCDSATDTYPQLCATCEGEAGFGRLRDYAQHPQRMQTS